MKDQYFGDKNDFFKFDLVFRLIEASVNIKTFTFIPMLTENDDSGDGKLVSYDGSRRRDLEVFLKKCVSEKERKISKLQNYMIYKDIIYIPYRDTEYFSHNSRSNYFNGIEDKMLRNAIILIDPDNGFEVKSMKNSNRNKYVKYSEIQDIYNRMDSDSVLIVYQHIGRVNRLDFFNSVGRKLNETLNSGQVICVSDNVIVFFIITKDLSTLLRIDDIQKYAEQNKYKFYQIHSRLIEEVVNK